MKYLILAVLLISLSGCVTLLDDDGHEGSLSPKPLFLKGLPQDESAYSKGFRDGCYNMMGQTGYGMVRYYDRAANPDDGYITDRMYQLGYRQGDRHCGVYVNNGIIL